MLFQQSAEVTPFSQAFQKTISSKRFPNEKNRICEREIHKYEWVWRSVFIIHFLDRSVYLDYCPTVVWRWWSQPAIPWNICYRLSLTAPANYSWDSERISLVLHPSLPWLMGQNSASLALQKWIPFFYTKNWNEKDGEVVVNPFQTYLMKSTGLTEPGLFIQIYGFRLNSSNEKKHVLEFWLPAPE